MKGWENGYFILWLTKSYGEYTFMDCILFIAGQP